MCTLTFIPKPQGYLLGMNRDERLSYLAKDLRGEAKGAQRPGEEFCDLRYPRRRQFP